MYKNSVINNKENISEEVELLNLTCMELVAQIERLEKENARLKKEATQESGSRGKPGFSEDARGAVSKKPHLDSKVV